MKKSKGAPLAVAPVVVPTSSASSALVATRILDGVDERRVLPSIPERHSFPVDFVHDAPMVKRAGGMPLIVEGLVELMPGARIRFDRPETIPPPVRAVMRALHKRQPFYLVIGVGEKAWWVELTK